MVLRWGFDDFRGTSMVLPWDVIVPPWDSNGTPTGVAPDFHGTAMGLPQDFHGTAMGVPWDSNGISMGLP